jgi:hypothetical protein
MTVWAGHLPLETPTEAPIAMKVGIAPLSVAVIVAGARVLGWDLTADTFGCVYLAVTTVLMSRRPGLSAPQRA